MKNSPRNNPTKDVTTPGKQKHQGSANRAGTYINSQPRPQQKSASLSTGQPTAAVDAHIKSSRPLLAKQGTSIPSSAAQGDDDIMSQEKASSSNRQTPA